MCFNSIPAKTKSCVPKACKKDGQIELNLLLHFPAQPSPFLCSTENTIVVNLPEKCKHLNADFSSPEPKAHWWAYRILMVQRPSVVRPSSVVVNNFKHILLQNLLSAQSQILCGATLGRGNESLFVASGSHDQHGRHAHSW